MLQKRVAVLFSNLAFKLFLKRIFNFLKPLLMGVRLYISYMPINSNKISKEASISKNMKLDIVILRYK